MELQPNQYYQMSISRTFRHTGEVSNMSTECGFNKESLKEWVAKKYDIILEKDERDDFPWFTDGGFLYQPQTEDWSYYISCHIKDFIP